MTQPVTLSQRATRVPASPIRELMPLAQKARGEGVKVYHLNIGQPDIETPESMRALLTQIPDKTYAYTPSEGTEQVLSVLRDYYRSIGIPLDKGQIITTTGGSEALLFTFMAIGDPGAEIITPEPLYTNYRGFAAMGGLNIVPVTAVAETGFHLPPVEDFERAITPQTVAILLCNPNNPTGAVYSVDELRMVGEICSRHGLYMVVDEVYREFSYDGRKAVSALSLEEFSDRVIVVDSMSKRYSACGIRLGALVSRNKDIMAACTRMAQARLSPPGLAQMVALGIHDLPPSYTSDMQAEYQARRDLLFRELNNIPGVFLRKPEGAFYLVVRLPVDDARSFARYLLEDFREGGETVMIAPAEGFYATAGLGKNEARLAYVLEQPALKRSVELLGIALQRYRETPRT